MTLLLASALGVTCGALKKEAFLESTRAASFKRVLDSAPSPALETSTEVGAAERPCGRTNEWQEVVTYKGREVPGKCHAGEEEQSERG
ncbi:MAG: hypothetical protein KatS3mg081_2703 [Gemmatimonadales bacterium]|nr:MAG: hypothetical protein KatS3mg081_2703 [Gemmatimonadales bacterium]